MEAGCFIDGIARLDCIPSLINAVVRGFLIFAGAVSLFLILWGGIRLVTSGGDAKQVEGARKIITSAIIGLVVVLSSFAIVYFIAYLTKSDDCITNPDWITKGGCP